MDANDELNSGALSWGLQAAGASESCDQTRPERLHSESPGSIAGESAISAVGPEGVNAAERAPQKDILARLALIPFVEPKQDPPVVETKAKKSRWFDAFSVAASLILIGVISVGAVYDHSRQSTILATNARETESLASTVSALKIRLDAIEGEHGRDEASDLRRR